MRSFPSAPHFPPLRPHVLSVLSPMWECTAYILSEYPTTAMMCGTVRGTKRQSGRITGGTPRHGKEGPCACDQGRTENMRGRARTVRAACHTQCDTFFGIHHIHVGVLSATVKRASWVLSVRVQRVLPVALCQGFPLLWGSARDSDEVGPIPCFSLAEGHMECEARQAGHGAQRRLKHPAPIVPLHTAKQRRMLSVCINHAAVADSFIQNNTLKRDPRCADRCPPQSHLLLRPHSTCVTGPLPRMRSRQADGQPPTQGHPAQQRNNDSDVMRRDMHINGVWTGPWTASVAPSWQPMSSNVASHSISSSPKVIRAFSWTRQA